jgi:hypothetical protein
MPETETKHDKFKRLATLRVPNAIKKIELIGNLAGSGYESSPEDVEKIISTLQKAVDGVKEKFSKTKTGTTPKFEL